MAIDNATLNIQFNINQVAIVGTTSASTIFNQYDEFGLLVGLDRLPSEKSISYKQRLMDTFIHRANSTYTGMINGVTRELGLSLFKPFRIRPKTSSGIFIGENPIVIFNGPFIELWRNKAGNILEMEIDRFSQSGIAYTIKELYDYINANSTYFAADLLDTAHQYDRAMTILNQTNETLVVDEMVPSTDRFTLLHPNTDNGAIILTKIFFSDNSIFATQVGSIGAVTSQGKYYVDPYTGDVTVYSIPNPNTTVRYSYIRMNDFSLVASPVIINDITSENFKRKMFQQVLADDGKYYHGIPTELGADLINELLSVHPLYYSE